MKIMLTGENSLTETSLYLNDNVVGGVEKLNISLSGKTMPMGEMEISLHEDMLSDEIKDLIKEVELQKADGGYATYNIVDLPVRVKFNIKSSSEQQSS